MKKIFCLLLLSCLFICNSVAQENVSSESFVYCELQGKSKTFKNKVTVNIDMGQRVKTFSRKNRKLVDENNKPIEFNSMIDAMNYMGQMGWEFVQAYAVTIGETNVYHWLLKKEISKFTPEEQASILSDIKLNQ